MLFIGVLFTYPLQIYPVIEITEAVFLKYRKYRLSKRKQYERMSSPVADSDEEEKLITDSEERPAIGVKVKFSTLNSRDSNVFMLHIKR